MDALSFVVVAAGLSCAPLAAGVERVLRAPPLQVAAALEHEEATLVADAGESATAAKVSIPRPRLRLRLGRVGGGGLRLLMQLDGLLHGLLEPPQSGVEAAQVVHLGGKEANGDRHQETGDDDGDLPPVPR